MNRPTAKIEGAPDDKAPLAGTLLGGVVLKELIGEGGAGEVYSGWHTRLETRVAVKVMKKDIGESALPLFLNEARLAMRIDHPNIVRVLDVNLDPTTKHYYIVMEHIEGTTVFSQMHKSKRPMNPVAALGIMRSVAKALVAIHAQGIIHRDVKPENILIRKRDGAVKLADLGIAALPTHDGGVESDLIGGTLGFADPEVLFGGQATPASDIFSLGVTLYELLTLQLPYGAVDDGLMTRMITEDPTDPRAYVPALSEEIAQFLLKCVRRDPKQRYASADEALVVIERLFANITDEDSVQRPVILCVDDESAVLAVIREVLDDTGCEIVSFTNSVEALKNLTRLKPDVVILDLNMPVIDGLAFCTQVRATPGYEDLGIILFSGNVTPEVRENAHRLGIIDIMEKPIDLYEMSLRAKKLVKQRGARRKRQTTKNELAKSTSNTTLPPRRMGRWQSLNILA